MPKTSVSPKRPAKAPQTPVDIKRQAAPPIAALEAGLTSPGIECALANAVAWRRWIIEQGSGGAELDEAIEHLLRAMQQVAGLLLEDPAVRDFYGSGDRVLAKVGWYVEALATGKVPAWDFGAVETLEPDQRSRYNAGDWALNGAEDAELVRIFPYIRWMRARERGQPLVRRGKKEGDGALWPGGLPTFLEDLWSTLEARIARAGTASGHDPTSDIFRRSMNAYNPAPRTIRKWLKRAGLSVADIKSGRVTRANYVP